MKRSKPSWFITNVPWEIKKLIWKLWESGLTVSGTATYLERNPQEYPVYSRHTITKVRDELMNLPGSKLDQLLSEVPEVEDFVKELRPDYAKPKAAESEQQAQHSRELSTTLLIIASNLEKIRNTPPESLGDPLGHTIYTMGGKIYGGSWAYEDQSTLGDVDEKVAIELLKRLQDKGEFPELADIEDWRELKENSVTEVFIQRLNRRAHQGNL